MCKLLVLASQRMIASISTQLFPKVYTPVGPLFLTMKGFPSLDEHSPAKSPDYCKLINGWEWFESQTCRGWLQGHLCEVWQLKTWDNWEYGMFNAFIGYKWPPEKNNLSVNGLITTLMVENIFAFSSSVNECLSISVFLQAGIVLDTLVTMFSQYCEEPFV